MARALFAIRSQEPRVRSHAGSQERRVRSHAGSHVPRGGSVGHVAADDADPGAARAPHEFFQDGRFRWHGDAFIIRESGQARGTSCTAQSPPSTRPRSMGSQSSNHFPDASSRCVSPRRFGRLETRREKGDQQRLRTPREQPFRMRLEGELGNGFPVGIDMHYVINGRAPQTAAPRHNDFP